MSEPPVVTKMSGYGTTLEGSETGLVGNITRITLPTADRGEIDVSDMDSPDQWEEVLPSIIRNGELSCTLWLLPAQAETLVGAIGTGIETWTITLSDKSTYIQDGYLKSLGGEIPFDGGISQTVSIRMTGKPAFTKYVVPSP